VLAGDHVYKMDYGSMLAAHVDSGADVTVGCIEVPLDEANAFGVMAVDPDLRITQFEEKPERPQPIPGNPYRALASMGIYIFNTRLLFDELARDRNAADSTHDFGRDIIPSLIHGHSVFAYPFRDPETGAQAYWRDVGTVDSFWQANMELIGVTPELNLYDRDWPIWTYQEQAPPGKFVFDDEGRRGSAVDSMVSGGCIVSGASVKRSLLFSNVHVHSYCRISDAVIFPEVDVGRRSRIRRAVIDKLCAIPPGTDIGYDPVEDARRFYVSPKGIVLVTPEMLGQQPHHA
jgi:glucose-1-phosphate adenylyltransferase